MKKVKTVMILLIALAGAFAVSACSAERQEESSGVLVSADDTADTRTEETTFTVPTTSDVCPNCGSADIAVIQYGYPPASQSEEQARKMENSEIVWGGCVITATTPQYHCNHCGYEY